MRINMPMREIYWLARSVMEAERADCLARALMKRVHEEQRHNLLFKQDKEEAELLASLNSAGE